MSEDAPDEQKRAKLIADALHLALDASQEGARSLSDFLTAIEPHAEHIVDTAGETLRSVPSDDLAASGARLANDAISAALKVGVAAKNELEKEPARRERDIETMSQLVSWLGSMFVDTANRAVGTAGGSSRTNRPRQLTVEVPQGEELEACAWVVNRGQAIVSGAEVHVLEDPSAAGRLTPEPQQLTIGPRQRRKITLKIRTTGLQVGSFSDALLVVEGVGSIVVRTIVKDPPSRHANSADAASADVSSES
jgi:hypothetical protein